MRNFVYKDLKEGDFFLRGRQRLLCIEPHFKIKIGELVNAIDIDNGKLIAISSNEEVIPIGSCLNKDVMLRPLSPWEN